MVALLLRATVLCIAEYQLDLSTHSTARATVPCMVGPPPPSKTIRTPPTVLYTVLYTDKIPVSTSQGKHSHSTVLYMIFYRVKTTVLTATATTVSMHQDYLDASRHGYNCGSRFKDHR